MSFSGPGFVIAIIAITTLGWIITTAIRAKHGYPLTDDWGNTVEPKPREEGKLAQENAENLVPTGRGRMRIGRAYGSRDLVADV